MSDTLAALWAQHGLSEPTPIKVQEMSDTPETDAFFFRTNIEWDDEVEFARGLERQRDEARRAFAIATDQCVAAQSALRKARDTVHRLRKQRAIARHFGEQLAIGLVTSHSSPATSP